MTNKTLSVISPLLWFLIGALFNQILFVSFDGVRTYTCQNFRCTFTHLQNTND